MSIDFACLDASLSVKITNVLNDLKQHNFEFVPFSGYRSLEEQAKLWRQSRKSDVVNDQIEYWRKEGANFLADILESVGPQRGKHVTNSLPGYSWHNHGKAVDCFLEIDGKAIWDAEHPGYKLYADIAQKYGLTAGFYFKSFKDAVHIQIPNNSVKNTYSLREIDELFSDKYGK